MFSPSNRLTNIIALMLLGLMFATSFLSMRQTALTFDELAHIPAGYSYLAKQDYRVNPEHPPLVKDIPAIPLLFLDLNFPDEHPLWTQEDAPPAWWVQFDLGREFVYRSGNNAREIIVWSRFAMIILLLLTGWLLFYWTKKEKGNSVALGVLFLFAFSPTFIAHGMLVNTDIGAVFGVLLATFLWLNFLKKPSWKNVFLAGVGFGTAMIFKFSLVLLIPFFVVITLLYAIIFSENKNKILKQLIVYSGKAFLSALIGVIFVIWPIYQFHVINYPVEHQLRDTIADISGHPIPFMVDVNIWMTEQEPLRGLAQYLRGLLMASQRTLWGNTATFMGEISADSWPHYFPVLYLLKIPLALHFLTLIVLIGAFFGIKRIARQFIKQIRDNFWLIAFLIWISIYWAATLVGNLNIGIRHLLPIFPFVYIIVVWGIIKIIKAMKTEKQKQLMAGVVFILFGWYAVSSLATFPHYIPYYNELAGGTKNGYRISVDSNYDWGQDFYRLLNFIEKNEITKIHIDYFGGEDPDYWLKERYVRFNPKEEKEPPKGWLAVSLNHFMGGTVDPAPGFDQETGYYDWLKDVKPIAKAGHSILIYYID